MTREEAIEMLKNTIAYESNFAEAKRMAIEALTHANSRSNHAHDLISRADAIACLSHGEGCGHSCRNRIKALPSAESRSWGEHKGGDSE